MNQLFFPVYYKNRPKSIAIKIKPIITNEFSSLSIASHREVNKCALSPLKTEDILYENLVTIRKLNNSACGTQNLTPAFKNRERYMTPVLREESILFYPKEPTIHTNKVAKKKNGTPIVVNFKKIQGVNWVFGGAEEKKKGKAVGRIRKGRCEYPRMAVSPIRMCGIKFGG